MLQRTTVPGGIGRWFAFFKEVSFGVPGPTRQRAVRPGLPLATPHAGVTVRSSILVRGYGRSDRQAVRGICAATCWMGEDRPELIPDDWVWAEYWTRYFTDEEPRHTWVACEAAGRVVGYLTGTADERRFHPSRPH